MTRIDEQLISHKSGIPVDIIQKSEFFKYSKNDNESYYVMFCEHEGKGKKLFFREVQDLNAWNAIFERIQVVELPTLHECVDTIRNAFKKLDNAQKEYNKTILSIK